MPYGALVTETSLPPPLCQRQEVQPTPWLRPVAVGNTWQFARQTDAAFVKIDPKKTPVAVKPQGEAEKFLFYRGVGNFSAPLSISTDRVHDQFKVHSRFDEVLGASETSWTERSTADSWAGPITTAA